jgi:poly-gamma-glutamate capsule biosynthesis protein CapA/YwtB (metallophosphatase superfamily)
MRIGASSFCDAQDLILSSRRNSISGVSLVRKVIPTIETNHTAVQLFRRTGCLLVLTLAVLVVSRASLPAAISLADTIENFESGSVTLFSFPGLDQHPDAWRVDSILPHENSRYSLKLWGNTWKVEHITPVALDTGSVWQIAAYIDSVGEIQGFGVVDDSARTLMYCFSGTQLVNPNDWITVYQGAFTTRSWHEYQLLIADDWRARYGSLPTITGLIYINARVSDPHAAVYFDNVVDLTTSLPVSPRVSITYTCGPIRNNPSGTRSVDVQFVALVDPDTGSYTFRWDFGDGTLSAVRNPLHTYILTDDHPYTALLNVMSSAGRWGRASVRVHIDPGPTTFPLRASFVGDIMLARRYEQVGGIIPTLGVNAIFTPTRPFLGEASDLTVANLESPLTNTGTPHPTKSVVFRSSPANVSGLVYAGFDVVSLANNHVIDYGLAGLQQMQSVLRANAISFSGAGADANEAFLPTFWSKSGVCIAFVASSDRTGQYNNEQPFLNAGFNKPGFANLTLPDLQRQIEAVRPVADLVVAEMHAGSEYSFEPSTPFSVSASAHYDGDEDFETAMLAPSAIDILTRTRAIELGADLVVCHHPHVLQGFQVYNGKLIAHSLGNFTFDLDYPETMPTAILNASIDGRGFFDYSVVPVYIDHYIPRRATGELGLHLLDYLARRSRDLGTWLVVDSQSVTASIVLDTSQLRPRIVDRFEIVQLQQSASEWVSTPVRFVRGGSPSSIENVSPQSSWRYRTGRDVVWFGNFENEGCALWSPGSGQYDSSTAHAGRRSLLHRRTAGSASITSNIEKRILCDSAQLWYSVYGYIKTSNANGVTLKVKCYASRSGTEIGSFDVGTTISGTTDWTFYRREFTPTSGTAYFDIQLSSAAPASGTGSAWFDDVGIVQWSGWQPCNSPSAMVTPNDYYWMQFKTSDPITTATVSYRVMHYDQVSTQVYDSHRREPDGFALLQNYPNPFNPITNIRLTLPIASRVTVTIYNILGQQIRTLLGANLPAGSHRLQWNGTDDRGQPASSGVYFLRLEASPRDAAASTFVADRKLLLVK